ncbi:hypothetical protein N018_20475 [Pseudomonas syringae CC1557]|uniref:Uncharacterized protein n=1 Tax=Pseudomonas syringae CC1557 TaxID=1357279 RepID=W0N3L8_PSESX|nr:hypothetical protein N018_20475 [Pseudomonas syringae CC1557]
MLSLSVTRGLKNGSRFLKNVGRPTQVQLTIVPMLRVGMQFVTLCVTSLKFL